MKTKEEQRLEENLKRSKYWLRWGPYLSERQWGTVREDYSHNGDAWNYLSHDISRSRAYRWGEDGIGGISDNHQRLCFALALWNEKDPILKERLFGLAGPEGNHGEDVKEYYYYLDSTPTHSYMKYLYRYPINAYPYDELVARNSAAGRHEKEVELIDTGVLDNNMFFDVFIEYARKDVDDLFIRITAINRSETSAKLRLLPTIWFRNTWSWETGNPKPVMQWEKKADRLKITHQTLGDYCLYSDQADEMLFTENETNMQRTFGKPNHSPYVKDSFHEYLMNGKKDAINPKKKGTKCALHYNREIGPGEEVVLKLRLTLSGDLKDPLKELNSVFKKRISEADAFYDRVMESGTDPDSKRVQRQAFAGLLWTKQFYHYSVEDWLNENPLGEQPDPARKKGRNSNWRHFYCDDILSMPDKWEYPWFAAWDTAFHTIPLALVDPEFAKNQLILLTREWYMHPNGQLPAYEWDFNSVNPPVHAWAALRVFQIESKMYGRSDYLFLERVFQKLLMNFTWWVNRKDSMNKNIFQGGFLGLDNIGVFDRNTQLPSGGYLEQADGTSWMAMYCQNMLRIAIILAKEKPSYEDIASKFFEHFVYIADAINKMGVGKESFWDQQRGFYFDMIHFPDGSNISLRIHSIVGLIPLLAVDTFETSDLEALPSFRRRVQWFYNNRKDLMTGCTNIAGKGVDRRFLLSVVGLDKLPRILEKMLDEERFLSEHGIRSMSKYHEQHPFVFDMDGQRHTCGYEPGDAVTPMFGGNSNWRGPIWFPINYLLIEALQKYHHHVRDDFKVEYPAGSGKMLDLWEVSSELSKRLISIFRKNGDGKRPVLGSNKAFRDEIWNENIPFYEFFHGDTGEGLGASHQTGWTGLVAKMILQQAKYDPARKEL